MLTPFQLNQLSQPVVDIYSGLENDILTAIVKRLKTDQNITKDSVLRWQLEKLAELGDLNADVLKLISDQSDIAEKTIMQIIDQAGYGSVEQMDDWLKELAEQGEIKNAVPLKKDTRIFETLKTFQNQAKSNFNLVNSSILANSLQVYRQILSESTAKVLTGLKTHDEALTETASKWAEKGIPALIDRAGKQWSIEGYVPLVMRSISNDVANQTQWDRMDSYELDLIEVSSHSGARPLCAPYQGRIFSRNGQTKGYKKLSETSYGKAAGLFGCNCGHVSYPYIPGVSTKTYSPYPAAENKRAYELSQKQRYLERRIRKAKTEKAMAEKLSNPKAVEKARLKIRRRQANMRQFINETGRTRRYDREQIQS